MAVSVSSEPTRGAGAAVTAPTGPARGVGVVSPLILLLLMAVVPFFVLRLDPVSFSLAYLIGQVVPCVLMLRSILRFRPAHPLFWWALVAYYGISSVGTAGWVLDLLRGHEVDMLEATPLRVFTVLGASIAVVTAMTALVLVRLRAAARWAVADAGVIGLAALTTLLITNVLPLHDRLGWSAAFWVEGVLLSARFLVLIAGSITLLFSEQLRNRPAGLMVCLFAVWAVLEPIWVQAAPALDQVALTILQTLLASITVAATVLSLFPAMRQVAVPSESPRPTWNVGRTIALCGSLVLPMIAFWFLPPQGSVELAVLLGALSVLLVAVVLRMRGSVLTAHRLLEQVEVIADHDQLTRLPNRRYLYGAGLELVQDRVRSSGPLVMVVTYLDLDNLREVNDRLDHVGGDLLLRAVAEELVRAVTEHPAADAEPAGCRDGEGPTDDQECMVIRVGGDEFVVVTLAEATRDGDEVARRSQRQVLRALDAAAARGHDSSGSVGTSWGRLVEGELDQVEHLVNHLLQEADMAQAEAKRAGGARGVQYEPVMGTRARTRGILRRSLPGAWAAGQMAMAYQSVVDLRTGDVIGMESLLRWRHPDLGMIPPPDAIDAAIDLGLIVELGLQILDRAQQDLLLAGGPVTLRMGVNLAAPQLRPAAVETLMAAVHGAGLAGRIWLEVTEQQLVQERRFAHGALTDLRVAGALIALDDFGTGFCSLDYLCSLPVDLVKLDKVFARHHLDPVRQEVSRTVCHLADVLGAEVIAEGIEDWSAAATMSRLGARFGQGYGLRRPTMSAREAAAPIELPSELSAGHLRPGRSLGRGESPESLAAGSGASRSCSC